MGNADRVSWEEFVSDCSSVLAIETGGSPNSPWAVVYGYGRKHDFMVADVSLTVKLMLAYAREKEKKRVLGNISRILETGE